jgi:aspartyl-tRNA(Asn)/glutamyl-tRNA(Gln) amidotransferase subunit B
LVELIESGQEVVQETRGFDESSSTTYSIRTKEDADDYRYFADPDLPPFLITEEMIEGVRRNMPPSQKERVDSLIQKYQLSAYDGSMLAADIELEKYFVQILSFSSNTKSAVNWVLNPIKNWLVENETNIEDFTIPPKSIAEMIGLIDEEKITYGIAVQKIFPALLKDASIIVQEFAQANKLLLSENSSDIDEWINTVLEKNPQKVTEFRKGKKGLIGFFVGEAMRLAKGQADAKQLTEKLNEKLKT